MRHFTILSFLVSSVALAAPPAKKAEPPKPPAFIALDQQQLQQRAALDLQQSLLNQAMENLRIRVCWEAGVPPAECGAWAGNSAVMRITPKVEVKPKSEPKK